MRLRILVWSTTPDGAWRTIGWLYGCRVELEITNDDARVRVDPLICRRGGPGVAAEIAALVERVTHRQVTDVDDTALR